MAKTTADAITQLARLRDPDKRSELAAGVTDLCTVNPLSETAEPIAGELLITLSGGASTDTRVIMAKKLAACDWAPHTAIRHFAFEEIEVASIIIKSSNRLTDQDMIDLAKTGSVDHRKHLARRPNLHLKVTDVLAEPAEPIILRALANNDTAEISENTLSICMNAAKDNPKLREALARRHDLSTEYATQLCIMLPENWREEMYRRFGLDKEKVENMTIEAALGGTCENADTQSEEAVNQAEKAGTLDGQFVLAAAKAGDSALFDHAIARLCKIKVTQWRVALAMSGVRAAAMACQASGLPSNAYPVIHKSLQHSGRMHQSLSGDAMSAAANVFRMYGPDKASKVLRQMGSRV